MRISVKTLQQVCRRKSTKAVPVALALFLAACADLSAVPGLNPDAPNLGPNDPNPVVDSCRDPESGAVGFLFKNGDTAYLQFDSAYTDVGSSDQVRVGVTLSGQFVEVDYQDGGVTVSAPAIMNPPAVGLPISQAKLQSDALSIAGRLRVYAGYVLDKGYIFPHSCDPGNGQSSPYLPVPMRIPGINMGPSS